MMTVEQTIVQRHLVVLWEAALPDKLELAFRGQGHLQPAHLDKSSLAHRQTLAQHKVRLTSQSVTQLNRSAMRRILHYWRKKINKSPEAACLSSLMDQMFKIHVSKHQLQLSYLNCSNTKKGIDFVPFTCKGSNFVCYKRNSMELYLVFQYDLETPYFPHFSWDECYNLELIFSNLSLLIYDLQSKDWIDTYYMLEGYPKCQVKWNVQMKR